MANRFDLVLGRHGREPGGMAATSEIMEVLRPDWQHPRERTAEFRRARSASLAGVTTACAFPRSRGGMRNLEAQPCRVWAAARRFSRCEPNPDDTAAARRQVMRARGRMHCDLAFYPARRRTIDELARLELLTARRRSGLMGRPGNRWSTIRRFCGSCLRSRGGGCFPRDKSPNSAKSFREATRRAIPNARPKRRLWHARSSGMAARPGPRAHTAVSTGGS